VLVLGRKGWLFSDTVHGAVASANLYSLVETAKANGVEPHAYLSRLFERLPHLTTVEEYEAMLPWNIKPSLAYWPLSHSTPTSARTQLAWISHS
jgi:transposase